MQTDRERQDDWEAVLNAHIREKEGFYRRLAYGVIRNAEDAADVCQQAFLRAWEHRHRIRRQGAIGKWLTRVVINESYGLLRRGRSEQRMLEWRSHPASVIPSPAEVAERRDMVMAALAQLPDEIREVVTLRLMQSISGNDVSKILELHPSDVSRRLHEGLDQLRQILGDGQVSPGGKQ